MGYKIEFRTDHNNLLHKNTLVASNFLMRWRLILDQYGPDLHYIPVLKRLVADSLSRISMIDDDVEVNNRTHTRSLLQEGHLQAQEILLKRVR